MDIHHSRQSSQSKLVARTRKLIEQSKALLEQGSANTFLGISHYEPFPLAQRSKKAVPLRVIHADQSEPDEARSSAATDWQTIRTAPFGRDLQLAVINLGGVHALVFPCHRVLRGWVDAETNEPVLVRPTHWREWDDTFSPAFSRPS